MTTDSITPEPRRLSHAFLRIRGSGVAMRLGETHNAGRRSCGNRSGKKRRMCVRHFRLLAVLAFVCVSATAVRAQPAKVDLEPEFQKRGLTARVQGDRDTCSLFAITGAAEFECTRKESDQHPRLSEEFLIWAANEATGQTGDQA